MQDYDHDSSTHIGTLRKTWINKHTYTHTPNKLGGAKQVQDYDRNSSTRIDILINTWMNTHTHTNTHTPKKLGRSQTGAGL